MTARTFLKTGVFGGGGFLQNLICKKVQPPMAMAVTMDSSGKWCKVKMKINLYLNKIIIWNNILLMPSMTGILKKF
jgi:hypothetical protein